VSAVCAHQVRHCRHDRFHPGHRDSHEGIVTRLDLRSPVPEDSGLRQTEDEDEDISGTIVETLRRQATLNMALLTGAAGSARQSREMPPRSHSMPETEEQRRRSGSAPTGSEGDADVPASTESTAFLPQHEERAVNT
jgi:hypothetical protein